MKKCIKCDKESDGNFCVFCGEKLVEINEDNKEKEIKKAKQKINKNNEKRNVSKRDKLYILFLIICIITIIALVTYIIIEKNNNDDDIDYLINQISILKKEKTKANDEKNNYWRESIKYKDKADFLDENIVFVLDGYGNYYYTYDQAEQVTQGRSYTYWAYNKEAAISKGYRAWK